MDWNEWEDIIFAYKGYNGTGSKWAWDEEAEYANVNDFLDVGLENPILTEIDFFPANKSVKDAREKLEEALSLLLKLENRKKTRS
ncbi:hypothetical protein AT251_22820 [Enterovibrio nigricans]|nr:hypothetical protein [Enterovibrio nigricans]PKF48890.1 hypothetical protein AT251_22820 [Enterovibrio nigricans]